MVVPRGETVVVRESIGLDRSFRWPTDADAKKKLRVRFKNSDEVELA